RKSGTVCSCMLHCFHPRPPQKTILLRIASGRTNSKEKIFSVKNWEKQKFICKFADVLQRSFFDFL
ncbi:MAG: hypothetical protein J5605_09230, partial [Bacteroidales bacterium]|nr:hypothetical protein [Bacteroidales bacterium]